MPNFWMVRAGEAGYLFDEFAAGTVGIGWNELGDLALISSQEEIRRIYDASYQNENPSKASNAVAMIWKFRSQINEGDGVITYNPAKRIYLVGTISSKYLFSQDHTYHHIRRVEWKERISRDALKAASRNSLGSLSTLFSVSDEVWSDIQAALSGETRNVEDVSIEEEKHELVSLREDLKSRAHELIKDKILKLTDEDLEELCAAILRAMGYRARRTPQGPDRGVDVIASRDGLGLEEPRIKVEAKHRAKTQMGSQEIRSFLGGLRQGDRGLYVSSGGFTKDAKYEAERANIPLTLLDLDDLADLITAHYDNFDLDGRALIPLIRLYYPVE